MTWRRSLQNGGLSGDSEGNSSVFFGNDSDGIAAVEWLRPKMVLRFRVGN
jgi:hypothetical protein